MSQRDSFGLGIFKLIQLTIRHVLIELTIELLLRSPNVQKHLERASLTFVKLFLFFFLKASLTVAWI